MAIRESSPSPRACTGCVHRWVCRFWHDGRHALPPVAEAAARPGAPIDRQVIQQRLGMVLAEGCGQYLAAPSVPAKPANVGTPRRWSFTRWAAGLVRL